MSATDLDRYLTDEMIEQGRKALTFGIMGCGCCGENPPDELDHLDFDVARAHVAARAALTAALEAVLPDIIRQAKAEALREAADQLDAYSPRDNPTPADPRWTCDLGYYGEAAWLRVRADRIEQGGKP